MKKHTYNGNQYTIPMLAKMKGLSYEAMRRRVIEWGIDRAMSTPVIGTSPDHPSQYEHNGEKVTVEDISKLYDINAGTLRSRLARNGGDIEKAIALGQPKKPGGQTKYIEVAGERLTYAEMAERGQCSVQAIRRRLDSGKTPEEAVKPIVKAKKPEKSVKPKRERSSRSAGCPFDRVLQQARVSV